MERSRPDSQAICRAFQVAGQDFLETLATHPPEPWQREYTAVLAAHFPDHCRWLSATLHTLRTVGGVPYAAFLDRLAVLTRQVRLLGAEVPADDRSGRDNFELAFRFEEEVLAVRQLFLTLPVTRSSGPLPQPAVRA